MHTCGLGVALFKQRTLHTVTHTLHLLTERGICTNTTCVHLHVYNIHIMTENVITQHNNIVMPHFYWLAIERNAAMHVAQQTAQVWLLHRMEPTESS